MSRDAYLGVQPCMLIHPVHSSVFPLPDGKVFLSPPFFFKWQDRELGLYLHVCEDSETHGAQIQLVGNSPRQPPFAVHVSSSEETGRADCNSSLTVLLSRDESLVRQGRKGKRGNGAVARTCAAHTTLTNRRAPLSQRVP